jgi:Arginase family
VRKAIGVDALAADMPQDIHGIDVGPSPAPFKRVEQLAAGALPVVLGGDHSVTEPSLAACGAVHRAGQRRAFRHARRHRRGGLRCRALTRHVMRRVVEAGQVNPRRYVQIGRRGY